MRYFITIFLLIASCTFMQAQNYWLQMDSIKGPGKSVASAFAANGVGYIVGGLESTGFTRRMFSYDVNQNDWDSAQALGGINGSGLSRGSACGFSILNKGYVCLGQGDNTNYLGDVWEYDPVLDVWTQKADYGGSARRAAVSFVIGGYAYVGTGQDVNGLCDDFYKYDPVGNLWSPIADFAGTPRKYAVGFSMGNQGYVGTGDDGTLRSDFWQYQATTNSWSPKANFPGSARSGAVGWGIFPQGFIATGEDYTNTYCSDVWEYNYFTNTWTPRASLPAQGRKHAIAFTIGNIAYLGAGYNGALLDDFYSYYQLTTINELQFAIRPVVYPNPSRGSFTLSSDEISLENCTLQFSDATGRDATSLFTVKNMNDQVQIQSAGAAPGIYHIVVKNENGMILSIISTVIEVF